MKNAYICLSCKQSFKTQRSINCHISKSQWCNRRLQQETNVKILNNNTGNSIYNCDCNMHCHYEGTEVVNETVVFPEHYDTSLLEQAIEHENNNNVNSDKLYMSGIE
jgi:hypothetical protein